MSEAEIIQAVRQLAADLNDLGASPVTKSMAAKLLRTKVGEATGGPLTQWWNRETDERRKDVLRDIIKHVVKAGYMLDPDKIQAAADKLPKLCDRLETATAKTPKPSRVKPDHPITTWMATHRHKYADATAAVKAYSEIHGGNPDTLYQNYNNDKRKKTPKARSKKRQ